MADHTDNALLASIKALDDVVMPALDPANPLAREQLKLVSRFLGFLRQRIVYTAERDLFELNHYLALAHELMPSAAAVSADASQLMGSAIDAASTAAAPQTTSARRRAAIDALSTAISVLVRSAADAQPAQRRRIERTVVLASRQLFDAQRAWYLPIGFEPDPGLVPPIDQALAARPGLVDQVVTAR